MKSIFGYASRIVDVFRMADQKKLVVNAATNLSDLRIAVICDQFTALGIQPECDVIFLDPEQWRNQIIAQRPHALLIESCWSGPVGEWQGVVRNKDDILCRIVKLCRSAKIPTIFWAKEDPVHFDDFIETAKLFDWVFTTDEYCIPKYEKVLRHSRVGVMTFPVQPRMHNPISSNSRSATAFFAGAWYANFPRRCEEFIELGQGLMDAGPFSIYQRPAPEKLGTYPLIFRDALRPAVDYKKIGELYRQHQIGITINTVTRSPTMFARRAVEMLASGTTVYSNPCLALSRIFPGLIDFFSHRGEIFEAACLEYADPASHERKLKRIVGVRDALASHSWEGQLLQMMNKVFFRKFAIKSRQIAVLAEVSEESEIEKLSAFLAGQKVQAHAFISAKSESLERQGISYLTAEDLLRSPCDIFGPDALLVFWSPLDWYGSFYLHDLRLSDKYYGASAIGRASYYVGTGSDKLQLMRSEEEYSMQSQFRLRTTALRASAWIGSISSYLCAALDGDEIFGDSVSIDSFSYAMNIASARIPSFLNGELM